MTKEETLNLKLGYNPIFYIIDEKEQRVVAIKEEVTHGYDGTIIEFRDGEPHNSNQFFIAKTFIANEEGRYDFTKSLEDAINCLTLKK